MKKDKRTRHTPLPCLVLIASFAAALLPLTASAQSDCDAVRQARRFAQSQDLDSHELARLERQACRRRRPARAQRPQRPPRQPPVWQTQRPSQTASASCSALQLMNEVASIAGDQRVIADVTSTRRAVCATDFGDGALLWANGVQLRTRSGVYYWPNGAYARSSSGTWYYPNGAYARSSSGTWYYPNGAYAKSSSGRWYTARGAHLDGEASAFLYVCQRASVCERPRGHGSAELSEARLIGMLWSAG